MTDDVLLVGIITIGIVGNILNITIFSRKCIEQPANHLLLWISVFDLSNIAAGLTELFLLYVCNYYHAPIAIVFFIERLFNWTSFWLCIFLVITLYYQHQNSFLKLLRLDRGGARTVNTFALSVFIVLFAVYSPLFAWTIVQVINGEAAASSNGQFRLLTGYILIFPAISLFLFALLATLIICRVRIGYFIGRITAGNYRLLLLDVDNDGGNENGHHHRNHRSDVLILLMSKFLLLTELSSLILPIYIGYNYFYYYYFDDYSALPFYFDRNGFEYLIFIFIIPKWLKIFIYYALCSNFRDMLDSLYVDGNNYYNNVVDDGNVNSENPQTSARVVYTAATPQPDTEEREAILVEN